MKPRQFSWKATISIVSVVAALFRSADAAAKYSTEDALTQLELCQAAYCDSDDDALPAGYVVTAVIDEQSILPGARALVGCAASGNFWVAYRGSSNVKNWADNVKFVKTRPYDDKDIKVEMGFYEWYGTLKSGVTEALLAALADPKCGSAVKSKALTITGHSAGGAVATLHAFDVLNGNDGTQGAFSLTSTYTYGSPRVGNEAFFAAHDALMKASNIPSFRVTHYRDMVPHLPQENIGFHHVATEVFYDQDSSSYKVCDGSGEDDTCSNTCAPLHCTSIDDHLNYLGVPLGSDQC